MKPPQFVWELVFQENPTFRSSKIRATLAVERVVEWLMYNTYSWPHVNADTDHTSDMMKVTLGEALGSIKWINPDDHLILVELIGEFEKVPVRLSGNLSINLL